MGNGGVRHVCGVWERSVSRMGGHLWTGLLILAVILAPAASLHAHPHVWIDTIATFVFERGKLVGIRLEWTFDEFLSDTLLRTYDTDKDRQFDDRETRQIQERAFSSLQTMDADCVYGMAISIAYTIWILGAPTALGNCVS